MSDLPPVLLRPTPPPTWRDRCVAWAESLDLTPARLLLGVVAVAAVLAGGWWLLQPPPPPAEMQLPMTSTTPVGGPGAGTTGTAGSSDPAAGGGPSSPSSPGDVAEVVVHVAGAVAGPGVQRLPVGARVVDAVDAAGGAAPDADLGRVNLAAPLVDGQQVYVPKVGEPGGGAAGATGAAGAAGPTGSSGAGPPPVVDLNTATLDQLDELPGVGPSIAQAILDHRAANGPFGSVEELLEVRGIGQAKLDQLRSRVSV
jgi:competence protein ComEA